jgi:hypothetical protein
MCANKLSGSPSHTQVPTEAPSSRPITWLTVMSTTAPNPLAPSDQWARVATGQIFAGGIPVPLPQERPGRELKATPADRDAPGRRRELAAGDNPTIQACFEACLAYFGPNYAQFFSISSSPGPTRRASAARRPMS